MKVTLDVDIVMDVVDDEDPDLSWLEQSDADMGDGFEAEATARLQAYGNDEWRMVGVRAVMVSVDGERIATSPGLWNVESDSSPEYLAQIFEEEKSQLFHSLGVVVS